MNIKRNSSRIALRGRTNRLERLVEALAADLVMASFDDLPGLAKLHEDFLQVGRAAGKKYSSILPVAKQSAALVEKIILNEAPDKEKCLSVLRETVSCLQAVIRDRLPVTEVVFPVEVGLSTVKELLREKSSESEDRAALKQTVLKSDDTVRNSDAFVIGLENTDLTLLGDFIVEAREHCATAEQMLMELETGADNDTAINAIFRSFHTIKGAAGFLDLRPVSVLAHESETLLDLAREGVVEISGIIADTIFDSVDVTRKLLDGVEGVLKNGRPYDSSELISGVLSNLRELIEDPTAVSLKSARRVGDILIDMGAVSQPQIDRALARREHIEEKLGETLVKQGVVPARLVARALRSQQLARKDKPLTGVVRETIKIDTERLDRLVDTIGELVIAESMVGQDEEILSVASPKMGRNISHLNKITRELQEMGMAMRLVPVRPTFQKLARAVRDLTRKSGKEIELSLSGEETEVDRGIVENIGDPLMHMIRNCVDHGIESPEERLKAGKPPVGRITVKAYHKGGNIYFDVEDDGRGLDRERILAKAREKGLIGANKELTEKEINGLILVPGFSTATLITDISGRGVGMDVVKKNIDALRGHLEIRSVPGEGTLFSIKLPLTLAIIDGMLVSVEGERFIIPTLSIVESLSLKESMVFTLQDKAEMINLRGEILPLIRVDELLHLPPTGLNRAGKTVVVVEDGVRRVGLVVNELLGQRQTVIKSLGSMFAKEKWIAGGAIMSDGKVGLIIDVGGVVSLAETACFVVGNSNLVYHGYDTGEGPQVHGATAASLKPE